MKGCLSVQYLAGPTIAHRFPLDFGLADFEGKGAKTQARERIGAVHYIAPEMLNNAGESEGPPADVFSLAKTLWVLATGQTFPLPATYDIGTAAFRIGSYVNEAGTTTLDRLIATSTVFEPKGVAKTGSTAFAPTTAFIAHPAFPASAGRMYIYADDIAIDGGKNQPVRFELGQSITLRDAQDTIVRCTARAVLGPCFLIDIVAGP
jgi:hypothetical protein